MKYLPILFLLLLGCQPSRPEEFKSEGRVWMHSLTLELKKIHSTQELEKKLPLLTKTFNELANLLQVIEKKKRNNWITEDKESEESLVLQEELERIFMLPKAREIFETAQTQALQKLNDVGCRR